MVSSLLDRDEDRLFSFVVVADTHINEREGFSSSPYQTNALANARARHVFLDIASMNPAPRFVVHLGDIVHPVPSLPTFDDAVACFKDIIRPVDVPVHLVPGNHDVGDKRVPWMPADQVCGEFLDTYRTAFGADYFSFDDGGICFVMINSLLINSGLEDEQRQQAWLEDLIANAGDKRLFLFMHYPPYIYSPDERGNYDNLDEPGRSWLLDLVRRGNIEAVFAGHVHNFWYDRIGEAEFYMLPSTAFLRHDFTEFYRVAPAVEFGRGDVDKFGYFVVDVYKSGHVVHSIRTMGAQAEPGTLSITPAPRYLAHPKTSDFDCVGVELRHPWTESMQITATGGVQEFGRKWARNDYPLLALWEMGVRLSKVPDIDLLEPESRARMQLLARLGHRYIVTVLGRLRASLLEMDLDACGVIAFELNVTAEQFETQKHVWKKVRQDHGVQIYYANIREASVDQYDGTQFSHFVKSGLVVTELDSCRAVITEAIDGGYMDGVTVRVEPDENLCDVARRLSCFHEETGALILASLKLSGPSLAVERTEDRTNAVSVGQAMVLSRTSSGIRYIYDTFMDIDRGYFPRHAFIDRHFNPREMARVFTTLTALLAGTGQAVLCQETEIEDAAIRFRASNTTYMFVFESLAGVIERLKPVSKTATIYDLVSGENDTVNKYLTTSIKRSADALEEQQLVLIMQEL